MTIDIFIKSHRADFWLLQLALQTITKNVTGYNNLILLIPQRDSGEFDTRILPPRTLVHYVTDEGFGWLRQQWYKMTAHNYCFSEYIMFSDSDCFFTRPINLQDVVKNNKPEILCTDWSKVGDAIVWRKPTEKFIGEPVAFERMRRNNQVYHRSTLVSISQFSPDLEQQIMGAEDKKFSEFNCMSSYAFRFENDKYTFVNTDDWTYVPPLAEQVWSHSSKREGASETHLREYIRTLETILKSYGVNIPQ